MKFCDLCGVMKIMVQLQSVIMAAVMALCAMAVCAQGSAQYFDLMGMADKAAKDGAYERADSALTAALRLEPGNPSNYLLMSNLGMIRHYMGKDSVALSTLNMAHDMAPASVTVLQNRARVLTDCGRLKEAFSDYDRVLRLDSTLTEPRFYHAMLALRAGDMTTAQADVDRLEKTAPDDRYTHIAGAALYSDLGDDRGAIACYTRLINVDPQPDYYAMRAELYLHTGDLQEASNDIAAAMETLKDDAGLYVLRAALNKARYRPDDAEADGRRAIELGADPRMVKRILGKN